MKGLRIIILLQLLSSILFFLPAPSLSYSTDDCISCHSEKSDQSSLRINTDGYFSSVHGNEFSCSGCHQHVIDDSHFEKKGSGKVDCQQCHEQQELHSQDRSVTCYSCHTRHDMYSASDPRSSVHWKKLSHTCGECHPNETVSTNNFFFLASQQVISHPKQNFSEIYSKSMCVGCHQGQAAHGEDSPVNDQNCYRCHIPLGEKNAVLGYIHYNTSSLTQRLSVISSISMIAFFAISIFLIIKMRFFIKK